MMTLYVKNGCPWCDLAEVWLRANGRKYNRVDVIASRDAYADMRRVSGQSLAPVLVTPDGRVLSDFGPEELPGFLG